jgi:membrane protease YdiL (CAAX protease family)
MMTFLASAELGEDVVLGKLDYAFYIWSGIIFLVGLAMFRKATIHYGEDQPSELQSSSQAIYGLFGLISFFLYASIIPGTLTPSLKVFFTQGDTAIYLALLIGQILGSVTLVAFAYISPGSLRFAPSASYNEAPQLPVQTFSDDVKSAWQSLKLRTLWPIFFSLCAIAICAGLVWRLFYYFSELSGQLLPEDIQPLVDKIANYDWSGPISPIILLGISCVIGAPIIEELVFRGMIYPSLKRWLPRGYAIIITGVFFGVVHANLAAVFPLMAFGSVLCIIRDRFGLFTCIALHALFNLHTIIWLYLAPNASSQL